MEGDVESPETQGLARQIERLSQRQAHTTQTSTRREFLLIFLVLILFGGR
jgi:hypothetical protein